MERSSVEEIVAALNAEGARYLIAGGLAVVAHGYLRLTVDVDLVLDLDPANVRRAARGLGGLGYTPRAPVPLEQLAEPERRAGWMRDKGMVVFSLFSPRHPRTSVDLFLEMPFDFAAVYPRRLEVEIAPGLAAPVVPLAELLEMKAKAGRPRDLEDIERLREIQRGLSDG